MKKTILVVALVLGGFLYQSASAQVRVNFKINIGSQPVWGPTGYDHVEYYYMPDIDAYYYVPKRQYIYQQRGRWIFSTTLPSRFNYDLYSGYKVVINEPRPYLRAANYRKKYGGFRGNHSQEVIRNSRDSRYFEIKDHPEHNKWRNDRNQRQGNGRNHRN